MAILVVRHAKAGERDRWDGDDRLRPLTGSGRRQAEALVEALSTYPFRRVLSSPYVRCVQTVRPLAGVRGLEVESRAELGEGHSASELLESAFPDAEGGVVLCTHGDVLQDLLERLIAETVISPAAALMEKASTWVLEADGGSIRTARHIPAP